MDSGRKYVIEKEGNQKLPGLDMVDPVWADFPLTNIEQSPEFVSIPSQARKEIERAWRAYIRLKEVVKRDPLYIGSYEATNEPVMPRIEVMEKPVTTDFKQAIGHHTEHVKRMLQMIVDGTLDQERWW